MKLLKLIFKKLVTFSIFGKTAYLITTRIFFPLMIFNGVRLSYSRQVAHVYYQLFDSKMADGDQLWSVPKLEYDLLCRNASTNGRKTDLIERYILHRKPKQTIYVRYFSILLYLLNVQVAPTENKENKTSL